MEQAYFKDPSRDYETNRGQRGTPEEAVSWWASHAAVHGRWHKSTHWQGRSMKQHTEGKPLAGGPAVQWFTGAGTNQHTQGE
eukprot:1154028-Pelagomonas_calceolata.AAC.20